jgi:ribosomal protein L32
MHRETLWIEAGDDIIEQRAKPAKVKREKRAIVKRLTAIKPVPEESNADPTDIVFCPKCGLYYRRRDAVFSPDGTLMCLICEYITK